MPLLLILLILAFAANIFIGTVDIDFHGVVSALSGNNPNDAEAYIVMHSRLPAAIAATLGGASLAVAGLMMQTAFRNPLAGPSIMGINSGASLGVAVVMLFLGGAVSIGSLQIGGEIAVIAGALCGALAVMAIIILLAGVLRNNLLLLIAAILVGYLASSLIMILNYSATATGVQSYVMWGMGSFNNVPLSRLLPFAIISIAGLACAMLLVKPLDALLLGDDYAIGLGINIKRVRLLLLVSTGILAAIVTAYCGPVAFIGLAVPHIARFFTGTDIHRRLFPTTMLWGAVIALICNLLCVVPTTSALRWWATPLPLNAVTPLFGVPVILYVILKRRHQ